MGNCSGRSDLLDSSSKKVQNADRDTEESFSIQVSPELSITSLHSQPRPQQTRDSIEVSAECEVSWKLDIENPGVGVEVLPTQITSISQNVSGWTILPESLLTVLEAKRPNGRRTGSFSISRSNSRSILRNPGTPIRVYPSQTTTTSSPQTSQIFEVESQGDQNFFPAKATRNVSNLIEQLLKSQMLSGRSHKICLNKSNDKDISLNLKPLSGDSQQSSFSLVMNGVQDKEPITTEQHGNGDSDGLNTKNWSENTDISQIRATIKKVLTHDNRDQEEYLKELNSITRWDIKRAVEKYLRRPRQIQILDFWTILQRLKISIRSVDSFLEGFTEGIEMRRSQQGQEIATSLDYDSFVHALHCVEPRLKCEWVNQFKSRSRSGSLAPLAYEMNYETLIRVVSVLRTSRSIPWKRREALLAIPCLLEHLYNQKLEVKARENIFQNICLGIYTQLTGGRSTFVIRQACLTVAEISTICETANMGLLMKGLVTCLSGSSKPVVSNSAFFSAEVLIASNVQTSSQLYSIIEGCSDAIISVRISCFKLLVNCCKTTFAKSQPADSEFWKVVVNIIESALLRSKFGFEEDSYASFVEFEQEQSKVSLEQELSEQLNQTLQSIALSSSVGLGIVQKIKSRVASFAPNKISNSNLTSSFTNSLFSRGKGLNNLPSIPMSRNVLAFPEGEEISPQCFSADNVDMNQMRDSFSPTSSCIKVIKPSFTWLSSPVVPSNLRNSPGDDSSSSHSSLDQEIVDLPFQTPPGSPVNHPRSSKSTECERNNRSRPGKHFDSDERSVFTIKGMGQHNRRRSWITSDVDDRSVITINDSDCLKLGLYGIDQEAPLRVGWESRKLKLLSLSGPIFDEADTLSPRRFGSLPLMNEFEMMNQSLKSDRAKSTTLLKIPQRESEEGPPRRMSISRSASKSCFEPKTSHDVTTISLGETFLSTAENVKYDDSKSPSSGNEAFKFRRDTNSGLELSARFQELLKETSKADLKREYERISNGKELNYRNFCLVAVEQFKLAWSVDKCKKTFKKFDKGKNKFISAEDFEMAFYEAHTGSEAFWIHTLRPDWIDVDVKEESTSPIVDDEKCYELLKDKAEDWKQRIRALEGLPAIVPRNDTSKFQHFMSRFKGCLKLQLQDRRSQVSRAACDVTARIVEENAELFFPYTPFLLKALYEIIAMKAIKVTRVSANECCIRIFRSVSDTKDKTLLLDSIVSASVNPHGSVRESAFEHVKIYIENLTIGVSPSSENSIQKIEQILKKGIADRSASVRRNALLALGGFLEIDEKRFQRLLLSMSTAVRKRFAKQIGRPDLAPIRKAVRRKRIRRKRTLSISAPIKE